MYLHLVLIVINIHCSHFEEKKVCAGGKRRKRWNARVNIDCSLAYLPLIEFS